MKSQLDVMRGFIHSLLAINAPPLRHASRDIEESVDS